MNNAAWVLRRTPLFLLPGDGAGRFQPVHVHDMAELMLDLGTRSVLTLSLSLSLTLTLTRHAQRAYERRGEGRVWRRPELTRTPVLTPGPP